MMLIIFKIKCSRIYNQRRNPLEISDFWNRLPIWRNEFTELRDFYNVQGIYDTRDDRDAINYCDAKGKYDFATELV